MDSHSPPTITALTALTSHTIPLAMNPFDSPSDNCDRDQQSSLMSTTMDSSAEKRKVLDSAALAMNPFDSRFDTHDQVAPATTSTTTIPTMPEKSKPTFFTLPAEMREMIYHHYLAIHRHKFTFNRSGTRVFLSCDSAMPDLPLVKVHPQVKSELLGLLYRESEMHVSVWAYQLTKPLDFSNLSFTNNMHDVTKLSLFQRLRFTLGETLEIVLAQHQDKFRLEQVTIPVYTDPLTVIQVSVSQKNRGKAFVEHVSQAVEQISNMGWTPARVKNFVHFLIRALIFLKRGDCTFAALTSGGELGEDEVWEAKEVLTVDGKRTTKPRSLKMDVHY